MFTPCYKIAWNWHGQAKNRLFCVWVYFLQRPYYQFGLVSCGFFFTFAFTLIIIIIIIIMNIIVSRHQHYNRDAFRWQRCMQSLFVSTECCDIKSQVAFKLNSKYFYKIQHMSILIVISNLLSKRWTQLSERWPFNCHTFFWNSKN